MIPDWKKEVILYEIFPRVFTEKCNFKGVLEKLDYLVDLGINMVWFMPIYPISETLRKGRLGSPYALSSHTQINPSLGNEEEFKFLVDEFHKRSIRVIIDWETNYTGWDHHWIKEHPEFYLKDTAGNILPPQAEWWDVARLNFSNNVLVEKMIFCMKYWIKNFNIDGFRCDMAGDMVGKDCVEYWSYVRNELGKDIFLLAEWDDIKLYPAFDLCYDFQLYKLLKEILHNRENLPKLKELISLQQKIYPYGSRLRFVENHDERRSKEVFGPEISKLFTGVIFCLDGVPLIYNGQEIGETERPSHFDPYTISWEDGDTHLLNYYKTLIRIRKTSPELIYGEYEFINFNDTKIFCFLRKLEFAKTLVVANFSQEEKIVSFSFQNESYGTDLFSGEKVFLQNLILPKLSFKIIKLS